MRNKLFGIITLVAIIGFSFGACKDGSDPVSGNPNGGPDDGNQGTAPVISTATLPGGTVGTAYNKTLTATGDTPITWSRESGALPAGLNLANNGTISGTPTTEGTYPFTVKATNAAGNGTRQLTIIIDPAGGGETFIEMVPIPGGTFTMGSPANEVNHYADETQHSVTLTGFKMGKFPVTQAQYQEIMGTNPSRFTTSVGSETSTAQHPVERVGWYEAIVFCNKLSVNDGLTPAYRINGKTDPAEWGGVPTSNNTTWNAVEMVTGSTGYRLPTEAQWEYACRAGTQTPFNTGDNITTAQANYNGNYPYNGNPAGINRERTSEVGSFAPNAFGLYDMHGNVSEWCWDWFGTYETGAQTDPKGAVSGDSRVRRGGSWFEYGRYLRSAYRDIRAPYNKSDEIGLRLVLPVISDGPEPEINGMVWIQGGTFTMGSPPGETDRATNETQHKVTLTGFRMGKFPVTQGQYQAVMGSNPSAHRVGGSRASFLGGITDTANFPVEMVSWFDAIVFCNKLSIGEGLEPAYSINGSINPAAWGTVPEMTDYGSPKIDAWNAVEVVAGSNGYRLPTEAQWEYACRAGTQTPFNTGNNITTAQANYDGNYPYNGNPAGTYLRRTSEVGSFAPNTYGLYDMHGNVWEFCWDWYGDYEREAQTDPTGSLSGYGWDRVHRGGSWDSYCRASRSAFRGYNYPFGRSDDHGIRLVLPNE
jgi:formylglycine-generating enzyme required for sulfatase activity